MDKIVLMRPSSFRFPILFVFMLSVFLALSLEVCGLVDGGQLTDGRAVLSRLRADLVAAVYFLVLSGYLFVFLLSYLLFTRKMIRRQRVLVSALTFSASYLFFLFFTADTFSTLEALMLLAGVVSVLASDFIADALDCRAKFRKAS